MSKSDDRNYINKSKELKESEKDELIQLMKKNKRNNRIKAKVSPSKANDMIENSQFT